MGWRYNEKILQITNLNSPSRTRGSGRPPLIGAGPLISRLPSAIRVPRGGRNSDIVLKGLFQVRDIIFLI